MTTEKTPHKMLVIGLDGAPHPLIEKWAAAGQLPHMAALIARGSLTVLNSTIPAHSPPAWTSFITGVNPGQHGVLDFVERRKDSYDFRVVRANHINGTSLWRMLSDNGRRVGIMNVPMTYPPEAINGFLVTGLGTPDYVPYTYPPELTKTLNAQGYRVNKKFFYEPGRDEEWLQDMHAISDIQGETAVRLLTNDQPDFFMIVFRNSDEICHFFWRHMDPTHPRHDPNAPEHYKSAILDLYQRLDYWVGQLVAAAGEDTNIIIMSDHGAGPLYRDVFLNEWLWQQDWLHLNEAPEVHSWARRLGITRKCISDTLTRLRLHHVEVMIKRALGDRINVLPRDERPEFNQAINWSKTQVYSFGYYGQIFINLQGREPQGIVSVEQYEALRLEIAARLRQLIDPADGLPVIDTIYFREDLYHGECVAYAPDLVCVMRDHTYITRKGYEFAAQRGVLFREPYTDESGSHRPEGILIAAGPDFVTTSDAPAAGITDLTPTILYLLACDIPAHLDGELIRPIIDPALFHTHPPQTIDAPHKLRDDQDSGWSQAQEDEIADRLRKLGYLR